MQEHCSLFSIGMGQNIFFRLAGMAETSEQYSVLMLNWVLRVFYTAGFSKPREFNWVVGVILLLLTLLLSFTGYLLPWDQLAIWAITVGSNMALPVTMDHVLGSIDMNQETDTGNHQHADKRPDGL